MTKREHNGANGKISLNYEWTESSSGHVETQNESELSAISDTVLELQIEKSITDFIRSSNSSRNIEKFSITVDELVELIKKHGTRRK
jgi:coenzyme F420-reducing hydrogenase delta subunit